MLSAFLFLLLLGFLPIHANASKQIKLNSKEVFIASPGGGSVGAVTFYTRSKGLDKACYMSTSSRSDTTDIIRRKFSTDNGLTWSDWEDISVFTKTEKGVIRNYPHPGWVDPGSGRLLNMVLVGLLPNDRPLEGMKQWTLHYRVSTDGGKAYKVDEQVIQKGDYSATHPLDGVYVGKNSIMIGAISGRPLRTSEGKILVPVQITPLGPDGEYHNPGGGLSYHYSVMMIGTWIPGDKLEWDVSQRITNDPKRSTRGFLEPTIAQAPDGRILTVARGSNDANPKLPGHKWHTISNDGGRTWSDSKPWTFNDGSSFYSPSSCSQLLPHSNGKIYWMGNISEKNPRGNSPRYPLFIGEVDQKNLLLKKNTLTAIDDRQPGENADLHLSNFLAYEDRLSGEIIIHLTRLLPRKGWRGDAYMYRIKP
jgi:BNR repeat-like domain